MHAQLNYTIAQQRVAELQRAAEHARLARDAGAGRRNSHDSNQITGLSARLARLTARLAP
jgi:hypothetical protein